MSRQLDIQQEERETARRNELIKVMEFGLAGVLETQGMEFRGFAITYDPFSCLMVVKTELEGNRKVAFVYSDTMVNCLLKGYRMACSHALKWGPDKYYPSDA